MQTHDIQTAKTLFSTLIDAVVDGETIIFTDGDIPVAKLSPVTNLKQRGTLSDLEFEALGASAQTSQPTSPASVVTLWSADSRLGAVPVMLTLIQRNASRHVPGV
ncbi:type II toxin-antitoxin system Phd/YefM family antitoxin [Pseudomonas sp. RT4P38]